MGCQVNDCGWGRGRGRCSSIEIHPFFFLSHKLYLFTGVRHMGIIQKMNCVYSHLKINTKAGFELVRNKRRRSVVCIFFSHKLFADFSAPAGTRAREWNGVKCVPNKPTLFEKEKKKVWSENVWSSRRGLLKGHPPVNTLQKHF